MMEAEIIGGYVKLKVNDDPRKATNQLARAIAEAIVDGSLHVGQVMASIKDMARLNGLSIGTVSASFSQLRLAEVIEVDQSRRHKVNSWSKAIDFITKIQVYEN